MKSIFTKCPYCGKVTEIEVTDEQYVKYSEGTELIQRIFPEMNPETREMLITGICPKCWDSMLSEKDPY